MTNTPRSPADPALSTPAALQTFMGASFPLSEEQFAAVTAPADPAVVIAGAGSGKTTLMAARVVWLVGTGRVRPHEILGLTFTTKAAGELAGRVHDALVGSGILPSGPHSAGEDEADVLEPTVSTYHAYAASLLSEHGLRIGHEPDTRVVADASRYLLAGRVIAHHDRQVRELSDHPPTVVNYLLGLDAQLSEHLVSPGQLRAFQDQWRERLVASLAADRPTAKGDARVTSLNTFDRREETLYLVEEYRTLKQGLGLMEFSDQIELGARLAQECPEVGESERAKFKVVLLDEYQDTSVAQALMLSRIFSGSSAASGRGHPVMAVGDPNQAIYGWRGASVSNILRFAESFPLGDGTARVGSYSLATNRRSDKRILELANDVVDPLSRKHQQVKRLEPVPEAPPGRIHAEVFETYHHELTWLGDQVLGAHRRGTDWRQIAVLTRDNAHAADVFDALTRAGAPVEIVGLQGLLRLPEVFDVVATLALLNDLTANAELLALLSGPRWAVGPRDLALLGARSRELARTTRGRTGGATLSMSQALAEAVAGADSTEVASLSDALADPGSAGYSAEAHERFQLLAEELRWLRQHASEPLLDLVRRIIDTIGLDVELASSVNPESRARRDNVDLFVRAVSEFQATDGEVSLSALLSWLQAENEDGTGLDVATPTQADSVKLLTVHRAKGLEWDAVFVVGVAQHKFPSGKGRPKWTTTPGALPYPLRGDAVDLPALAGPAKADFVGFGNLCKAHQAEEELRLAYVAFTRPRHELFVSSYLWGPTRQEACGPSEYQQTVRSYLEGLVESGARDVELAPWPEIPPKGTPNPLLAEPDSAPWPSMAHTREAELRVHTAMLVRAEMDEPTKDDLESLTPAEASLVGQWDLELGRLLQEARSATGGPTEVALPTALSATTLAVLKDAPDTLAAAVARPMPRPPSPAARFGTRFHAWVESYLGRERQELLIDPDELSGRADQDVAGDADLAELVERFRTGPFANRQAVEVEPPFALVLRGQVVRGRIDAVFAEPDGGVLVVDWKTNRAHTADPLQLAVYRLAWSELYGIALEKVRAAFYYVRDGEVVSYDDLPDRAALEALVDLS